MKRAILFSPGFIQQMKRFVKRHPDEVNDLQMILDQLSDDAYHPSLKTHKLRGSLFGSLACSAGYDLRIVFRVVQEDGIERLLLQSLGKHDEVY